jgi:hypothetical protein
MDMSASTPTKSGNGEDPVIKEISKLAARMQSIEELLEEVLEKLADINIEYGGFTTDAN